jgi:hypothetical protein
MRRWWPILLWLGFSLPAFWVLPALDDWGATAPLVSCPDWSCLAPGLFWRPLENLNRLLLGHLPSWYPQYLHVLTVIGHGLAAWFVGRLARRLGASRGTSRFAAAIFLIHPGVCSVVWSVDGLIRAWSTACGLASLDVYLSGNRRRAVLGWLLLGGLAALWYEAGLRWFLAAPLFREVMLALRRDAPAPHRFQWKRLGAGMATGLLAFAAYFVARWALIADLTVHEAERYVMTFDPLAWLRNAALLLGMSASTTDSIALLGPSPSYGAAALSFALGLPLLVLALSRCVATWSRPALLSALLCMGAVLAPHIPQAHVSEFYVHPVVAILVVLLAGHGPSTLKPWRMPYARAAVVLFAAASLAVGAHKAVEIIRTGRNAEQVGRAVVRLIPHPPGHVCSVPEQTRRQLVYSVFVAPPGPASVWGVSARDHWGWEHDVKFTPSSRVSTCPLESDVVIQVSVAGEIRVAAAGSRADF